MVAVCEHARQAHCSLAASMVLAFWGAKGKASENTSVVF